VMVLPPASPLLSRPGGDVAAAGRHGGIHTTSSVRPFRNEGKL
jgi:hypothetical protein